jgi:hypothetical protein
VSSVFISGKVFGLCNCLQHVGRCGVVAERFTHVDKEIFISGSEHKAATELERIFSQTMLSVSGGLCALAGLQVVFAQQMEQGSVTQTDSLVGFAFVVDQEWKMDTGFLAKEPGIAGITQSNYGKACAFPFEFSFKFAQLRDVLSAEDSTVMTKKDQHGGTALPQGAEARWFAIGVRERDSGQLAAE